SAGVALTRTQADSGSPSPSLSQTRAITSGWWPRPTAIVSSSPYPSRMNSSALITSGRVSTTRRRRKRDTRLVASSPRASSTPKPSLAERVHASRGCYREGVALHLTEGLAMNADTILAIDLGRYKSVACTYDRATRAHTFRTIDTTPGDLT